MRIATQSERAGIFGDYFRRRPHVLLEGHDQFSVVSNNAPMANYATWEWCRIPEADAAGIMFVISRMQRV